MKFRRILKEEKDDGIRSILMQKFGIDLDEYKNSLVGGVADNITIDQIMEIPLEDLIVGIETEFEHTNDSYEALEIALDHFYEDPPNSFLYYDDEVGLPNMEKQLEEK